jgi:hypothetical protein
MAFVDGEFQNMSPSTRAFLKAQTEKSSQYDRNPELKISQVMKGQDKTNAPLGTLWLKDGNTKEDRWEGQDYPTEVRLVPLSIDQRRKRYRKSDGGCYSFDGETPHSKSSKDSPQCSNTVEGKSVDACPHIGKNEGDCVHSFILKAYSPEHGIVEVAFRKSSSWTAAEIVKATMGGRMHDFEFTLSAVLLKGKDSAWRYNVSDFTPHSHDISNYIEQQPESSNDVAEDDIPF